MARTKTFVTDAIAPDETVVTLGECRQVTLVPRSGTILVREPDSLADAVPIASPGTYLCMAANGTAYAAGRTIATISASTGSVTVDQIEA